MISWATGSAWSCSRWARSLRGRPRPGGPRRGRAPEKRLRWCRLNSLPPWPRRSASTAHRDSPNEWRRNRDRRCVRERLSHVPERWPYERPREGPYTSWVRTSGPPISQDSAAPLPRAAALRAPVQDSPIVPLATQGALLLKDHAILPVYSSWAGILARSRPEDTGGGALMRSLRAGRVRDGRVAHAGRSDAL